MPENQNDLSAINISEAEIDADAAAILHSATQAVRAILDRRAALDRGGKHDKPLIVLAGENHANPAHIAHHMLVLQGLIDSGEKTVFGRELQHNRLLRLLAPEILGLEINSSHHKRIKDIDRHGKLSLLAASTLHHSTAGHSASIFYDFLHRQPALPVRFNDAAREQVYLDATDLTTQQSMKACVGTIRTFLARLCSPLAITTTSGPGMYVRNHHMATTLESFAREEGARIAVQHCGMAHALGNASRKFAFRHSLSAIFKQRSLPVLSMLLLHTDEEAKKISENQEISPDELLIQIGIPKKLAIYTIGIPSLGDLLFMLNAEFRNRPQEAAYINGLLMRTGMGVHAMSAEDGAQRALINQALLHREIQNSMRPHRPMTGIRRS